MRAATVDRRFEAIAGRPLEDVTEHATFPNIGHLRTGIAVGIYVPSGDPTGTQRQTLLSPTSVEGDPGQWTGTSSYAHGVLDGVWWVYRTFGTASALTSWVGPRRAVAYNRILNGTQAMAIVRILATTLQPTYL